MSRGRSFEHHLPLHPVELRILMSLVEGPSYGTRIVEDVEARERGRVALYPANLYRRIRDLMARDLIEVGAYRAGTTPAVDRAIELVPVLEQFLAQRPDEREPRAAACARLESLLAAEVQDSRARVPKPAVKT